jgi:hypothetical protein
MWVQRVVRLATCETSKNQDAVVLRKLQMAFLTDPLDRVMPVQNLRSGGALLGFWYQAGEECGLFWIAC